MSEAKDKMNLKDKILYAAYSKASVTPGCVEGDSEAIQAAITALHNEGLVKIGGRGSHGGESSELNFEITAKGAELVDNGGYAKNRRTEKRSKVKSELWNGLKFVLAAVVGGVIDRLLQIFFGI